MNRARRGAGQCAAGAAPRAGHASRAGRGVPTQQAAPRERERHRDGKNKSLCSVVALYLIFFCSLVLFVS
jgi:hypothetical protein